MKLRTITLATICTILTITLVAYAGTFTAQAGDLVLFHTRQLIYKPYALNYTFAGAIHGGLLPKQVLDYWSRPETFPAHGLTYIYYGAFLTPPYKYAFEEIWAVSLKSPYTEGAWFLRQEDWLWYRKDLEYISGETGLIVGAWDPYVYHWYFANGSIYFPVEVTTYPSSLLKGQYAVLLLPPCSGWLRTSCGLWHAIDDECNNIWVTLPNGTPLQYAVYCNKSRTMIVLLVKLPKYLDQAREYLYVWVNITGTGNPYSNYRNNALFSELADAEISDITVDLYDFPNIHLGNQPHYEFEGDTYVLVKTFHIDSYLDPIVGSYYAGTKIDYSYNGTTVGAIVTFQLTAKVDDPVITVWADDRFLLEIPSIGYVCNHWYSAPYIYICKLPIKAGQTVTVKVYWADVGRMGILMVLPYHFPITNGWMWRWTGLNPLIEKDNRTYLYIASTVYVYNPTNYWISNFIGGGLITYFYRNNTISYQVLDWYPPPAMYTTTTDISIYMFPIGYIGGCYDNHEFIYLGKVVQLFAVTDQVVLPSNYSRVLDTLSSRDVFFLFDPSYFNGSYVFAFLGDGVGLVTYPMKIDYNVKEGTYKLPNGKVVTYGWWVTPTDHPFAYVVSGVEPSQKDAVLAVPFDTCVHVSGAVNGSFCDFGSPDVPYSTALVPPGTYSWSAFLVCANDTTTDCPFSFVEGNVSITVAVYGLYLQRLYGSYSLNNITGLAVFGSFYSDNVFLLNGTVVFLPVLARLLNISRIELTRLRKVVYLSISVPQLYQEYLKPPIYVAVYEYINNTPTLGQMAIATGLYTGQLQAQVDIPYYFYDTYGCVALYSPVTGYLVKWCGVYLSDQIVLSLPSGSAGGSVTITTVSGERLKLPQPVIPPNVMHVPPIFQTLAKDTVTGIIAIGGILAVIAWAMRRDTDPFFAGALAAGIIGVIGIIFKNFTLLTVGFGVFAALVVVRLVRSRLGVY